MQRFVAAARGSCSRSSSALPTRPAGATATYPARGLRRRARGQRLAARPDRARASPATPGRSPWPAVSRGLTCCAAYPRSSVVARLLNALDRWIEAAGFAAPPVSEPMRFLGSRITVDDTTLLRSFRGWVRSFFRIARRSRRRRHSAAWPSRCLPISRFTSPRRSSISNGLGRNA